MEIITTKRTSEKRVVIKLFGKEYDLTDTVENGTAKTVIYGKLYEVRVDGEYKKKSEKKDGIQKA